MRTSNVDCFKKSVKTMLFYTTIWMLTGNNNVCIVHIIGISVLITVKYCKCILLFSPLNSYLYVPNVH